MIATRESPGTFPHYALYKSRFYDIRLRTKP
jgi:hypothetical protein